MTKPSVTHLVEAEHTAEAVGSGDVRVLGTPVVIAWLEEATCAALNLAEGQTSVGTRVDIQHVAASPVGSTITATAEPVEPQGRSVEYKVEAHDERGVLVAHGTVQRAIVDRERFMSRLHDVGK